jgi:hypothetical protein
LLDEGRQISEDQEVAISGDGLALATPSGLLNAIAKSIANLSSWIAIVISVFAVGVSTYALQQKPVQPKIIIIQSESDNSKAAMDQSTARTAQSASPTTKNYPF